MKIIIITITLFLTACSGMPIEEAISLVEELKEQGCEVKAVAIETKKSKKKLRVICK